MLLAAIAAFAGALVQSATGFGFALVLSPALFVAMDRVDAVRALLILGLALNLLVLFEQGRPRHVDWPTLTPILVAALPGLAVGALILTEVSKHALQVAVGVVVIFAALWQLRRRRVAAAGRPVAALDRRGVRLPTGRPRIPPAGSLAAGFASGVLTTSISVSGPPIVLWLEARQVRPEEFRASLAASFLALNLVGAAVVLMLANGGEGLHLDEVVALLVLVAVGYALGARAFRRLDRERFFTLVLGLVFATGVASVVAGLA